jgi:hypothetical protein
MLFAAVALASVVSVGVATAATTSTPSNATSKGQGVNEFGMSQSFFAGHTVSFTYTKGFYCDSHVSSGATSGCEVGANYKVAPAKNFDPLYILVPLGFSAPMMDMQCPTGLVCVDHPGTVDLSRIESALKPLYPNITNAQLTAALKNTATPGHQHYITTTNSTKAEWWDVKVVGVTSQTEYNAINAHKSYSYLASQIAAKKTTGVIPTNLFLYFSVK